MYGVRRRRAIDYRAGDRVGGDPMADPATVLVHPEDGRYLDFANLGVRFMIWSEESGGGFSLVEHRIPPRTLSAPLHRHSAEDEYSYVLDGRLAALLGDA
jgi:hypothetical protein